MYNRKTIRLKNYDYSKEGLYFITICIKNRECILSKIVNEKTILTQYGIIIENEIVKTEKIRRNVKIKNYVIMPNHVHIIIELKDVGVAWYATQNNKIITRSKMSISRIIQQLKTVTIKSCNKYKIEKRVTYHATPTMAT